MSSAFYSKYKAKSICSDEWLYGSLVKVDGHYFIIEEKCLHTDKDGNLTVCSSILRIKEDTICMCIGYTDDNKQEIYTNDVVKFDDFSTNLVWFNNEMHCLSAVDTRKNYIRFNGTDYYDGFVDFKFEDFCFMLQDPYGDFTGKIKVIGNIIDNLELLENVNIDSFCDNNIEGELVF